MLLRRTSVALRLRPLTRLASSQAKPKVLLLDPISLANDELKALEGEATIVVCQW